MTDDLFQQPSPGIAGGDEPPDILEAMRVLAGEMSPEELMQGDSPQVPLNAKQRWENGMLKKHEVEKAQREFFNYEIHVLDLAKNEDARFLADIFDKASAAGSNYQIEQTPPKIMGNSKSPRGFQAITIVKLWRFRKVLPPTS
jgi:hypothetical protein